MKVLVLYVNSFSCRPAAKNLDSTPDCTEETVQTNALLAFIQAEEKDQEKELKSREKKLVNHLKWVSRKNSCRRIILHSFAHLSGSKADAGFTFELLNKVEERLRNAGFETVQTPFGYFVDMKIDAPGFSMARVWADL